MSSQETADRQESGPITFKLALWWGYILSAMYILYGGVSIVLAFLDRNYKDMKAPVLFVAIGILVLVFSYAFRDRKMYGWYGLLVVNCAVILLSIFTLKLYGAVAILVLAVGAVVTLFAGSTRDCFPSRR